MPLRFLRLLQHACLFVGLALAGAGLARAEDGCAPLRVGSRAAAESANARTVDAAALRACRDAGLQQGLQALVRAQGLEAAVDAGRLALALLELTPGAPPRLAMLNGDRIVYAASLPKIAILLGALAEADAGRLPLDEARIAALHDMIRHSSNTDATRVLDWVGGERLLQILESPRYRLYDRESGGGLWVGKAYGSAPAFRRDPLETTVGTASAGTA